MYLDHKLLRVKLYFLFRYGLVPVAIIVWLGYQILIKKMAPKQMMDDILPAVFLIGVYLIFAYLIFS